MSNLHWLSLNAGLTLCFVVLTLALVTHEQPSWLSYCWRTVYELVIVAIGLCGIVALWTSP